MIRAGSLILFFVLSLSALGQIDENGTSAKVIAYWKKGESATYAVTHSKYKIAGDTTSRQQTDYSITFIVSDSTESGYTLECRYHDFKFAHEAVYKKLTALPEDLRLVVNTNEYGAVKEITNWEEVSRHAHGVYKKRLEALGAGDRTEELLAELMKPYTSKEALTSKMKDLQQLLVFHGSSYELNKTVKGNALMRNYYGESPFESEISIHLDAIDNTTQTVTMMMDQSIDSKQLTDATYNYFKESGTFGDRLPSREEFPPLSNQTHTVSTIASDSGWPTYSKETKKIIAEGAVNIDERIIKRL